MPRIVTAALVALTLAAPAFAFDRTAGGPMPGGLGPDATRPVPLSGTDLGSGR